MPVQAEAVTYNPYAFDVHDDPYATYQRLRDEAPAYWNPDLEFWALSRFSDVLEGFRDFETYSSAGGVALEQRGRVNPDFAQMIEMDPPEHTVLRKLVSRVFTGRSVLRMEDQIRSIVRGYIESVGSAGACDLVADITGPFPMDVIAAVLGVPESDRSELRRNADSILIRHDGVMELPKEALDGMFGLLKYFIDDLPRRRAGAGEGLISELAGVDVDGRALTDKELLGFCVLFVIAGHETTTKMVANAIDLLSRHPDQRAMLVDDVSLASAVVEEVLRFHNSTQYMLRTLTRDIHLHGRHLRSGESVLLLIGAANHDEREFGPSAGDFDITRRPERHLAFGHGAHFCLGAALARAEGRIAMEEIHRWIPDYRVDHDHKVRFHSGNVTGWSSLPITFTPLQPKGQP